MIVSTNAHNSSTFTTPNLQNYHSRYEACILPIVFNFKKVPKKVKHTKLMLEEETFQLSWLELTLSWLVITQHDLLYSLLELPKIINMQVSDIRTHTIHYLAIPTSHEPWSSDASSCVYLKHLQDGKNLRQSACRLALVMMSQW